MGIRIVSRSTSDCPKVSAFSWNVPITVNSRPCSLIAWLSAAARPPCPPPRGRDKVTHHGNGDQDRLPLDFRLSEGFRLLVERADHGELQTVQFDRLAERRRPPALPSATWSG